MGLCLLLAIFLVTHSAHRDSILFKAFFCSPNPLPAAWISLFDAIQHKGLYLTSVGPKWAVGCHQASSWHAWSAQRQAVCAAQPGTQVAQQEEQQWVWAGLLSCFPAWALCLSKENKRWQWQNAEEVRPKTAKYVVQLKWDMTQWHGIHGL